MTASAGDVLGGDYPGGFGAWRTEVGGSAEQYRQQWGGELRPRQALVAAPDWHEHEPPPEWEPPEPDDHGPPGPDDNRLALPTQADAGATQVLATFLRITPFLDLHDRAGGDPTARRRLCFALDLILRLVVTSLIIAVVVFVAWKVLAPLPPLWRQDG